MLCRPCMDIQYDELDQEPIDLQYAGYLLHANFAELKACEDCEFCKAVFEDIAQNQVNAADASWQTQNICLRVFPTSTSLGEEDKSNLLVYGVPSNVNKPQQTPLAFYGLFVERTLAELTHGKVDRAVPVNNIIIGRQVARFSNSEDCFKLANYWLDHCSGQERQAGPLEDLHHLDLPRDIMTVSPIEKRYSHDLFEWNPSFVPTRCIDVGPPDDSEMPRLVLFDQRTSEKPCHWVTLSHCWGGSAPIKTTLASISEWEKAIPLVLMPPTFYDAIIITRKLKLRYLWIDSLCIIQDSKEDWNYESKRMGNIYKFGILNISVHTAKGCFDGIFSKRSQAFTIARLPMNSMKNGILDYMYVRRGRWDLYNDIVKTTGYLNSRGWVLQESILSPRTLHFTEQQMIWECSHCTLGEAWILPLVLRGFSEHWNFFTWDSNKMAFPNGVAQYVPNLRSPGVDVAFRRRLYNGWLKIIQNYTRRNLTKRTDILIALAGAAEVVQTHLNDTYLVGLFKGDLLRSLLWHATDPRTSTYSRDPPFPSWSWASIVGRVEPGISMDSTMSEPVLKGKLTAEVLEATTYLEDNQAAPANHFLHVASGRIKMRGYILRATTVLDLFYEENTSVIEPDDGIRKNHMTSRNAGLIIDVESDFKDDRNVAILHVGAWEWKFQAQNSPTRLNTEFVGIVLKSVDGATSLYERIGIAKLRIMFMRYDLESEYLEDVEAQIAERFRKVEVTIL